MVLINIYKAYFLVRPIASLHDNGPPVHFPLSAAAWCVGGTQIGLEWTNPSEPYCCLCVLFIYFEPFFWQERDNETLLGISDNSYTNA